MVRAQEAIITYAPSLVRLIQVTGLYSKPDICKTGQRESDQLSCKVLGAPVLMPDSAAPNQMI